MGNWDKTAKWEVLSHVEFVGWLFFGDESMNREALENMNSTKRNEFFHKLAVTLISLNVNIYEENSSATKTVVMYLGLSTVSSLYEFFIYQRIKEWPLLEDCIQFELIIVMIGNLIFVNK